jgi:tryptophan 2,3-dioxygenase
LALGLGVGVARVTGRHSSDAEDLFVLKHRIQAGVMKLIDEQVKTAADCVASKPLRARR